MKRIFYIAFLFLSFQSVAQQPTARLSPDQVRTGIYVRFEEEGILPTNSSALNEVRLQNAINKLNALGGGILYGSQNYPLDGVVQGRSGVTILGNNEGSRKGTAGRGGAWFIVTDEANSLFQLGSDTLGVAGFNIINFGIDYPNQNLLTTTPSSSLIQYPTTIVGGNNTFQCVFRNLQFVGAWKMVEIDGTNADCEFDRIAGYPLSGRGIYINNSLDITRITKSMFSPSVGNYYRPAGTVATMVHSPEVVKYVMNQPNAFIEWNTTDEFYMADNFAFGYPTFVKVSASYGSMSNDNCDIGRVGLDLSAGLSQKGITVMGFSVIGSGGDNLAERNHIIVRGDGFYNFYGIQTKLGISSIPGIASSANNNAVLRIENTGSPNISIYGAKGKVYSGIYTYDIQNLNNNATLTVYGFDIPDATNKWSGQRTETNITASLKGLRIPELAGSGVRGLAVNSLGEIVLAGSADVADPIVLNAEFNGAPGTALSAYTPDKGTFTSVSGTGTLNGSGECSFPGVTLANKALASGNYKLTATISDMTVGSYAYLVINDNVNYVFAQVQRGEGGYGTMNISVNGTQVATNTPVLWTAAGAVFTFSKVGDLYTATVTGQSTLTHTASGRTTASADVLSSDGTVTYASYKIETL